MAGSLGPALGLAAGPGSRATANPQSGRLPGTRAVRWAAEAHGASGPAQGGGAIHSRLRPRAAPPATWAQETHGKVGPRRGPRSTHAYLTYCPFQIDFDEALSAPHLLQLKQFPPGVLLQLLFNLKGR